MSEVPVEVGDWIAQEDDIPEMHFPSSDEGAGQPAGVHCVQISYCVQQEN